jgi:ribosomal protein S10
MVLKIHIITKDFITINRFFNTIFKIVFIKLFVKLLRNQKKTIHFSILKSPHVNKKAQEQFGYTVFKKSILIDEVISLHFIILIKKLFSTLFSDM